MEFWPKKTFSLAIVGGGLAGVSLARGLLRRGISCQVFEGAASFADIGHGAGAGEGLSFAINSLEALRACDPESYEKFLKMSNDTSMSEGKDVYMTYRDGRTDHGRRITTLHCKGSGQQVVHRTQLVEVINLPVPWPFAKDKRLIVVQDMVSLMPPDTFHMNKRLRTVEDNSSGGVTLTFEDGSTFNTDACVGADGIKSRIRQVLLGNDNPDSKPKYSGKVGYRSLVPMDKAVNVLGEEFAKNGNVIIAEGALTTTYPVENGAMLNVLAERDQPAWEESSWIVPCKKETVRKEFSKTGKKMQQVVSLLENPEKCSLWHHPDAATFYRGRLAMIGDAAHAATPHQGADAGQAFEDALILANLLENDNIKRAEDLENAFAAFDAIRRPRTLKIVDTSRENGDIYMKRGPETGTDLGKIKNILDKRFEWIWYNDLDGQVESAIGKLKHLKGDGFDEDKRSPSQRSLVDESTVEASYRPAILRNESISQIGSVAAPTVKG